MYLLLLLLLLLLSWLKFYVFNDESTFSYKTELESKLITSLVQQFDRYNVIDKTKK
jgi:hypothetical protein